MYSTYCTYVHIHMTIVTITICTHTVSSQHSALCSAWYILNFCRSHWHLALPQGTWLPHFADVAQQNGASCLQTIYIHWQGRGYSIHTICTYVHTCMHAGRLDHGIGKHTSSTCIHEHTYMCFLLCPTVAFFNQKLQYCQVAIPHCPMSSTNTLLQREADSYRSCFKGKRLGRWVSTGCEVYIMCWSFSSWTQIASIYMYVPYPFQSNGILYKY